MTTQKHERVLDRVSVGVLDVGLFAENGEARAHQRLKKTVDAISAAVVVVHFDGDLLYRAAGEMQKRRYFAPFAVDLKNRNVFVSEMAHHSFYGKR